MTLEHYLTLGVLALVVNCILSVVKICFLYKIDCNTTKEGPPARRLR